MQLNPPQPIPLTPPHTPFHVVTAKAKSTQVTENRWCTRTIAPKTICHSLYSHISSYSHKCLSHPCDTEVSVTSMWYWAACCCNWTTDKTQASHKCNGIPAATSRPSFTFAASRPVNVLRCLNQLISTIRACVVLFSFSFSPVLCVLSVLLWTVIGVHKPSNFCHCFTLNCVLCLLPVQHWCRHLPLSDVVITASSSLSLCHVCPVVPVPFSVAIPRIFLHVHCQYLNA